MKTKIELELTGNALATLVRSFADVVAEESTRLPLLSTKALRGSMSGRADYERRRLRLTNAVDVLAQVYPYTLNSVLEPTVHLAVNRGQAVLDTVTA